MYKQDRISCQETLPYFSCATNCFIPVSFLNSDYDNNGIFLYSYNISLHLNFSAIAFNKVDDVREVLRYYRQFPDPLAKFRENQQILAV